jgi:hypothetical protein
MLMRKDMTNFLSQQPNLVADGQNGVSPPGEQGRQRQRMIPPTLRACISGRMSMRIVENLRDVSSRE